MIQFDSVSKVFPFGNAALDGVSFAVDRGEFVFLVGTSGAGKTSILKLISGELFPTSGSVVVDDVDISGKKFKKLEQIRRHIGVIFQDFKVLPEKNVFENIALGLRILNIPFSKIKTEVHEALQLVGLPDKGQFFPVQLSAGELQRVAIARAMTGDRHIILADEPTGNLDPKTTWDIMKIFKKVEKQKTVMFATHNTDVVNTLKKRVITMQHGKLIKDSQKGGYDL